MANRIAGRVAITIAGKPYTIAMGIGALAELADVLAVTTFEDLQERFARIGPKDMMPIMRALIVGNGGQIPDEDLRQVSFDEFMEWFTAVQPSRNKGDGAGRPPKAAAKSA